MKSRILLSVILTVAAFLFSAAEAQISASGNFSELQGKTCNIVITNKIKPADKKNDVLTFSTKEFSSSICTNANMYLCSKEIYSQDGVKYFAMEFKCEHNYKMIWEGEIRGNIIEGTLTSIDGNKNPVIYLFAGTIENGKNW